MPLTYIIQKSRRRSLSVTVTKDCKLLVKAPYGTTESYVREFLISKKDWIQKQLQRQEKENRYVGELGIFTPEEIKKIKREARKIIPARVEYYAKLTGITYNRIALRLQKSRWGSCSAKGNLNFNCLLVLMPPEVLDSVVVHELVHRHHMNHSRAFFDEVISIYPEYKKWDKWLKKNGGVFQARVGN